MERRYARRALTTVQGIVVRGGIVDRGTDTEEYIVVWSKKAGHSIAMMEKLSPNMRLNVNPLDWIQYDVEFMEQPEVEIPEGIRSRAVNLRLPSPGMSENPCDIADLFDKQRIIQNFSLSDDYTTIRFRDHYRLSQRLGALGVEVYAKSEFIEKAKLSSGDLCKLQEHGIREFDAVAVLEKVVDCHNDCPWIIEIFVVDGKEHAVSGLLSKKGMRMRGPGGVVLPRGQARVPPDVLRPNSNTKQPSRFSSVYSESKFVNLRQEQTDYYEAGMAAGLIQDGSDMLHQIPCPKLVKEEASIRDDSVSVMQHQNPNPKMVKDVSLIQSGSDTHHPMMARDVLVHPEAAEMIAIIRRLRGTKRLSVLLDTDAKLAELVKKIDEYLE